MNNWPSIELDQVCRNITVGFVGTMADEYVDEGVLFLRSQNILPYRLNLEQSQIRFISKDFNEKISKSKLYPGDIAIVRTGYPGTACVIPEGFKEVNCADLVIVRPDKTKVDSTYLCYYINSPVGKGAIFGSLVGVAQQHFNVGVAKKMKMYLPALPIQRKIASILSSYDELIENNNQRIKLLEEMAEEIYKEWFVRMRFPGYQSTKFFDEDEKEVAHGTVGVLPESWKMKPINSIVNIISGYAFKTESFDSEGIYKLVTIKNVQDGFFVTETTDFIHELPKNLKDSCRLKDKDIILSLTGNIGRICMVYGDNYILNQRVAKLAPREEYLFEFVYLMFRSKFLRTTLENLSNGAAQQNLSPIEMGKLEFPIPNDEILKVFSNLTKSFFDEIIILNKKNQMLKQTRDLLLPRLISGKLSVEHLLDEEENLSMAAEPELAYGKN